MISFKYFINKAIQVFDLDFHKETKMKDWWYFKLGKSIEKETLMNLSELVGHNLVWLKQEFVEHFNALLHRRSIEEMENDLMKKFKPVTFAEHLEFYYPGIYQDQTESLMTFALGLTLGYPNHSSLEDKWTPDEFQTLLRNWSNLSGPGLWKSTSHCHSRFSAFNLNIYRKI
ncbi:hypothetical protein PTTG_25351 [Puccinia triticina 1-1 BBBD Race 1]|uniref:Uncharacterized protein n=1 Tax=Puccinia triticina (isolate 1-1 / race 1 (BBBD)) TaxID=630390 RepID=A0A180H3E1_PUCT1|nr:hypothetical protein PTTG_25351 [Puccinia triticina 1-1 BBBD Race 1]